MDTNSCAVVIFLFTLLTQYDITSSFLCVRHACFGYYAQLVHVCKRNAVNDGKGDKFSRLAVQALCL